VETGKNSNVVRHIWNAIYTATLNSAFLKPKEHAHAQKRTMEQSLHVFCATAEVLVAVCLCSDDSSGESARDDVPSNESVEDVEPDDSNSGCSEVVSDLSTHDVVDDWDTEVVYYWWPCGVVSDWLGLVT